MISFRGDYSEGAHESILESLTRTNRMQSAVYGADEYTDGAKALIRRAIGSQTSEIRFLVGGTQTNQVALAHFLRPHQAVIATRLGHINVHETGAIEATGHKVIAVDTEDGKITAERVAAAVKEHADFHMVQPKVLYISNSTEIGTVYNRRELQALRAACDRYALYLYMDGARLGAALAAEENDLTWRDLPELLDAFYIGGTKNGALFGEALVVVHPALQQDLDYTIKRQGALLAKGRMLGLQFAALFENDLYMELARHAGVMAMLMKAGLKEKGCAFFVDSPTNQQFVILSKEAQAKLAADYVFQIIAPHDAKSDVVRFVTSWATRREDVEQFLADLPAQN